MKPTTPWSPKILAGANAALIAGLLITLLGQIQPGSLDFLGKWAPIAYAGVAILVFAARAYLKEDSLRAAGAAALQKAADEAAAAVEDAKQTSLAATAIDSPNLPSAPAGTFPAAAVEAALAAPVTVTPVFTPPTN